MSNFSDIYGYETIKEHLQSAISMGKVSHAYVISGGLGAGKKLIASTFAQTLQCEAGGVEPCGVCHSCVQAAGRNQPDIIWVGHEKPGSIGVDDIGNQPDIIWVKHEKPASIGVDDVREQIIADMQIKPYSSPYKIYIIDEADKLTVAAQNAMLKTIEEPPAYGIVILLANNPDVFLQTILSRCVVLDLKPLKDDVVIKYLKDHYDNIGDYECKFAARFAAGRIGRAMTMVESTEFAELRRDVMDVIKNAKDMDSADIMTSVKRVTNYKLTIDDYLDLMLMWYRDVLMFKSTNDTNLLIFNDQMTLIKSQAQTMSYEGLQDIINSIDRVKVRLQANVNFDLVIELLIMAIKENS